MKIKISCLLLTLILLFACKESPNLSNSDLEPEISSISSDTVKITDLIEILGKNFGINRGKLFINGLEIWDIQSWTDNQIKFYLPLGARSGDIYLISKGIESNRKRLTIIEKLIIDLKRTKNRCGWYAGDTLKVYGAFFGDNIGSKKIVFSEYWLMPSQDAKILSYSDTLIMCEVPQVPNLKANTNLRFSIIIKPGEESEYFDFLNLTQPNIKSIEPNEAFAGSKITIYGNFNCIDKLLFNNKDIQFQMPQDNVIYFVVPEDATTGIIKFIAMNRTSNEIELKIVGKAEIDSISPQFARIGDEITLYGRNFGSSQNMSFVEMNRGIKPSKYTLWQNDKISFIIPDDALSGNVRFMYNGNVHSNSIYYNIKLNYDWNNLKQFTKATFYKTNSEQINTMNVNFIDDTLITQGYNCFGFPEEFISKIVFDKNTCDILYFNLNYCYGYLGTDVGSIDKYSYSGANMKLIKVDNEAYIYESSNDFPSNISYGYHYWLYKTRVSGGKIETSEGSNNPTEMYLIIKLTN